LYFASVTNPSYTLHSARGQGGLRAAGGASWAVAALEKRVTGVGEERMNDGKIRVDSRINIKNITF
jgi:hypothetical protein